VLHYDSGTESVLSSETWSRTEGKDCDLLAPVLSACNANRFSLSSSQCNPTASPKCLFLSNVSDSKHQSPQQSGCERSARHDTCRQHAHSLAIHNAEFFVEYFGALEDSIPLNSLQWASTIS